MPCRALAASVAVTDQFFAVSEIATREGFILFLGWYRVVLGVFKTPPKGCGGSELGRREGSNLCSCLTDPKGPPARHRYYYSIIRLSTAEPLCSILKRMPLVV
jgi:hypothetical protein